MNDIAKNLDVNQFIDLAWNWLLQIFNIPLHTHCQSLTLQFSKSYSQAQKPNDKTTLKKCLIFIKVHFADNQPCTTR